MANSTEEWWSVDGVSLHQFGWSVTTVGGSRYDVPPRRGSNIQLAYRPGQMHRRKMVDARTVTLLMFMVGWEPGTGSAADWLDTNQTDQRTQWNDNWDFLRRLVYKAHTSPGLVKLTRRWRLTSPTFPTVRSGDNMIQGDPGVPEPGSHIVVGLADAEMTGDMAPTMTGRFRSEFQMDFTLADPYFFGAYVNATINPGSTVYVWNDGHDTAGHSYLFVDLVGPLTNPVLTNLTTDPDSWVRYSGNIPAGKTVTLDVGRYTARVTTGTDTNRVGLMSHYGARMWVNLLPGANKLTLTGSGSGHALLRFRPPYI